MTIQKRSIFRPFVWIAVALFVIAFISWQYLSIGAGPDGAVDTKALAPPAQN